MAADVEKMYRKMLHFAINRRFLRIRFRATPTDLVFTYELQTITNDTASAPFLATRTLQQIALDNGYQLAAAVEAVIHDFYIDDFLSGADDVESTIQLRKQHVPPEDLALKPLHDLQDEQAVPTPGLIWEPSNDVLRVKVQLPLSAAVLTKCKMTSYIAQIVDPLGLKLLALLVILGVGFASANLRSEVDQLLVFYPMEQVREIYDWWITHDAEVGEIYAFMQSNEADDAWNVLIGQPELQEISRWAEERDVMLAEYLNFIAGLFGWTPIPRAVRTTAGRSWSSMMEEIRAVTDTDGAVALANQFIATPGSEFAELYRMTQDARPAFTRTIEDQAVLRWSAQLRAFGVDIDGTIARLRNFFQWN
ncbi:uncharacterized protein LOC135708511 [Ochlerotatus camptorhynchus]|uniref:uncharacterized protein LOC135708511 n=1 Tax=Ochlerotatus camptorhynchus TaxID=644619 RepID=UPI0031D7D19B